LPPENGAARHSLLLIKVCLFLWERHLAAMIDADSLSRTPSGSPPSGRRMERLRVREGDSTEKFPSPCGKGQGREVPLCA
jgi:hypothetical protein